MEDSWHDMDCKTPRCPMCGRWIAFRDYEDGKTGHYHRDDVADELGNKCDGRPVAGYPCDVEGHWVMVCPACKPSMPPEYPPLAAEQVA